MTERDLLTGIATHPDEVERWLILADWLEDQSDPRAELARLRYLLHTEARQCERVQRQARELALLDAGLAPVVPTITSSLGSEFALVLPGTFRMGSPRREPKRRGDEQRHRVRLTRPFYLGVHPVTVGEFAAFVAATGYRTEAERDGGAYGYNGPNWEADPRFTWRTPGFDQTERHPVVCVNWADANALADWLTRTAAGRGWTVALPTESQWEYACRAGRPTAFFWGDTPARLSEFAWFTETIDRRTQPVGGLKPNPWGLWDMHGNVLEWVADGYGAYPAPAATDPFTPATSDRRINRGGSWGSRWDQCRAAFRSENSVTARCSDRGFRLAILRG